MLLTWQAILQRNYKMKNRELCILHEVRKKYRGSKEAAIESASFAIQSGEILGILGENGAGKSTLLSLIARTQKFDGGSIEYRKDVKKRLSYLPQELSLYQELTGRENMTFWGLLEKMNGSQIKVESESLLKELGLLEKIDKRVQTYSGGMKRRLHLATALLGKPSLLLLDEPFVGADEASIEQMIKILKVRRDEGVGIVLISHQKEIVDTLVDRRIYIKKGRMMDAGL